MRLIWLVLLSLPVAACSTTPFYQGLPATQSGADLTFVKGYERHELTAAPSVSYALNTEETCTNLRVAAALLWTTGAEKTVRVPSATPIYVWARTTFFYTQGGSIVLGHPVADVAQTVCIDASVFTPEMGHTYKVKQPATFRDTRCPLVIIDEATGAPAKDVRPAPGLMNCGQTAPTSTQPR